MKKNYHETELGKISDSVKNVKLSEKTESIIIGEHDNDFIDPGKQPVLAKINTEIIMKKIINWSELSRHITGGDRNCIRPGKVPKKHVPALDKLFKEDIPAWWEQQKNNLRPL